jgi:hypothetical protein
MIELTVFVAAFMGGLLGVLSGTLPLIYFIKKKWENSPVGAMFG